ncbi:hypothetical protein Taro_006521 [Colocasia esculenta]|uniref:Uncharacterized protein n=1 Tax=Colocasia esculenta TaxID=4460 RepID=A0A843TNY2_COLES|nr:hypothetical protein [Colocasia esculenta]
MVVTPGSIATCLLSRQLDPSRLGAHRFKTKATCSWCLERGGGGHSDVKAPTGPPILMHLRGSVQGDERTRVTNSGIEGKTVVRLLSSGRASIGRSRRGGSRRPRS